MQKIMIAALFVSLAGCAGGPLQEQDGRVGVSGASAYPVGLEAPASLVAESRFRNLPEYPQSAVDRGSRGRVILLVEVGRAGEILEIGVEASSGDPELDAAAVEAARHWTFRPATDSGGRPRSGGRVRETVRFDLSGL